MDPDSLQVWRTSPVGGHSAAVRTDNRLHAPASTRGVALTVDLATGGTRTFAGRHEGAAEPRIAIAPDGTSIVTGGESGDILVGDVARGAVRERLTSHTAWLRAFAITRDSRTLFSVGQEARVVMWDQGGDRRLDRRFDAGARPAPHARRREDAAPRPLAGRDCRHLNR